MRISRSVLREAGGETPPAYSPVTRAFQETTRGSGRHELITLNGEVRNCELLVIGLKLFLGKIDHDDPRVFA